MNNFGLGNFITACICSVWIPYVEPSVRQFGFRRSRGITVSFPTPPSPRRTSSVTSSSTNSWRIRSSLTPNLRQSLCADGLCFALITWSILPLALRNGRFSGSQIWGQYRRDKNDPSVVVFRTPLVIVFRTPLNF